MCKIRQETVSDWLNRIYMALWAGIRQIALHEDTVIRSWCTTHCGRRFGTRAHAILDRDPVCRERALKIQTGTDDMHERTLLVKITEVTQSFQQQNGHICSYFKAEIFVFSQYQCMLYFRIHKSNMLCML